jgi:hypothetical protein
MVLTESRHELVRVIAILVNATAGNPQLIAKVRGDGLGDLRNSDRIRLGSVDGLERALDLGEEAFVIQFV